jgi:hypothetical protein
MFMINLSDLFLRVLFLLAHAIQQQLRHMPVKSKPGLRNQEAAARIT